MSGNKWKDPLKKVLPNPLVYLYQLLSQGDSPEVFSFLLKPLPHISFKKRLYLVKQLYVISSSIPCPHKESEILSFIRSVFSLPTRMEGCIVEAGAYKGGSTAKFSIAAGMAHRKLMVFDSFKGLPVHYEEHGENIFGEQSLFPPGSYYGTLEEVKRNIRRFGRAEVCNFVKGWFKDTLPKFSEPIAAIYLDVDLAHSTRICLKYLYPLLVDRGILYSQDGHLPPVIEVFKDDMFWEKEVGCPKPHIEGLGIKKLIKIRKPPSSKSEVF